jgi:hypothetical protein
MGNGTSRHGQRPRVAIRAGSLLTAALLVAVPGCGGDDGDDATGVTADDTDAAGTAVDATGVDDGNGSAATDPATNGAGAGPAGEEVDVCALVSQDEVAAAIGMPAGSAQAEESPAPFFGCRYEDDGLTHVVSIGVIAWADSDDAEASFDFGADQYPAVEGIGERAYNSQPIGDVDVLTGRYEVSVSLHFVSDDDAAELAMARELAALVVDRLP